MFSPDGTVKEKFNTEQNENHRNGFIPNSLFTENWKAISCKPELSGLRTIWVTALWKTWQNANSSSSSMAKRPRRCYHRRPCSKKITVFSNYFQVPFWQDVSMRTESPMRLSWWLGRLRRLTPVVITCLLLYLYWKVKFPVLTGRWNFSFLWQSTLRIVCHTTLPATNSDCICPNQDVIWE